MKNNTNGKETQAIAVREERSVERADELLEQIEGNGEAIETAKPELLANPYVGVSAAPFAPEAVEVLLGPIPDEEIEIRPDGLIYLPEIKFRRILSRAFGPGAWAILPMEVRFDPSEQMMYYRGALMVQGRFVAESIGEQQYMPDNDRMSYATAAESAKSNLLMRCCKDLSIASELWDPAFVRGWLARHALEVWCVNVGTRDRGRKKKMWRRKDAAPIDSYPWKEDTGFDADMTIGRPEPLSTSEPKSRTQNAREQAHATSQSTAQPSTQSSPPTDSQIRPIISVKQVGRFRAIARSSGWSEAEQARLLSKFGFDRADDITRDAYDRICTALENPVILTEVRAEIDEEAGFGSE